MPEPEKPSPRSRSRAAKLENLWITTVLACITAIFMGFTMFFAYNSSMQQPYSPAFVAKSPERTILILNLLSQLTLFSLAELTSSVLDCTRWALASSPTGTSALTFLTLSRATSIIGTLYLSVGWTRKAQGATSSSHRLWGAQR